MENNKPRHVFIQSKHCYFSTKSHPLIRIATQKSPSIRSANLAVFPGAAIWLSPGSDREIHQIRKRSFIQRTPPFFVPGFRIMHSVGVRAPVRPPLRLLLDAADDAQHAQPVQDGPPSGPHHRQPHRQELRQVRPKVFILYHGK